MKIALEGCAHGELDKIYEVLEYLQKENDFKVDLLICCGDFQAVRNMQDLHCMAVPQCYKKLNSFYKYYSGEKTAPVLTLFIGGNHEASNYLGELSFGGWVCPNIYYMGYAGIVNIGSIRIAGLSGIYKGIDYLRGHHECPPYNTSAQRSAYHIRNLDVFRLKQVHQPIDIFLSHDWPRGVYNYGNTTELLRKKPFFRQEVAANKLGSRPTQDLLEKLKPLYWFSAHLHVKFAAVVPHEQCEDGGQRRVTKFLALDKCLPRREFLQILDIGPDLTTPFPELHYDPEWLCILKSTDHLLNVSKSIQYMPGPGSPERWNFEASDQELDEVRQLFHHDFKIPNNFRQTATPHDPKVKGPRSQPSPQINPQTTEFCAKLGITDPLQKILGGGVPSAPVYLARPCLNESEADVTTSGDGASINVSLNPDEVLLVDSEDHTDSEDLLEDDDDDPSGTDPIDGSLPGTQSDVSFSQSTNPDEISLGDSEDDMEDVESGDSLPPGSVLVSSPGAPLLSGVTRLSAPSFGRTSISRSLPEIHFPEASSPVRSSAPCAENADVAEGPGDLGVSAVGDRPPVKKLKRRNLAIYAARDDSSDDS